MGGFFSDIGSAIFGGGQAGRGESTLQEADRTASGLSGVTGLQGAAEAGQAGQALGEQMGRTAATQGTQAATQAARTQGINKGQAALLGGQQAGQLFTQGQTAGQGMGMGAYDTAAQRRLAATQLKSNIGQAEQGAGRQGQQDALSGLGGLASAGLGLLSDENAKKDIEDSASLDKASAEIPPKDFKYKEGGGEHTGVLAQDVEKVNPENVKDTPEGKMIDVAKQTGTNTARISEAGARIKRLEQMMMARRV